MNEVLLASIPSPEQGVWYLGPLPLRAYALCIVAGVIVCLWLGERRWQARGGRPGVVYDVAVWAIPFGLVGARLYHVITTPDLYFGKDGELVKALYVWEGGLGIWGSIALGALGAWIGCRRAGVRLPVFADAVAPGIVLAQAIGRWGNWFNQELFGSPTDKPWGLEIDVLNRPVGYEQYETFHPTFLYESLWDIGVAVVVILWDRRRRLGHGRAFALYVALYTLGRAWIEDLRIDDALQVGPFRLNVWTSVVIFVLAVGYYVVVGRLHPYREVSVWLPGREPSPPGADEADPETDSDAAGGGKAAARTGHTHRTGDALEEHEEEPDEPPSNPESDASGDAEGDAKTDSTGEAKGDADGDSPGDAEGDAEGAAEGDPTTEAEGDDGDHGRPVGGHVD